MTRQAVCPDCGSSETAKVLWGFIVDPFALDVGEDTILGGCCIPATEEGEKPGWGCKQCGAYFTQDGQVTGRARNRRHIDEGGTEYLIIDDG